MAYEQKANTGSSFENLNKRDSRSPDYTGTALVDGVEYFFDVWRNTSGSGKEFLSAKFKRKDQQRQQQSPPRQGQVGRSQDGEVPF